MEGGHFFLAQLASTRKQEVKKLRALCWGQTRPWSLAIYWVVVGGPSRSQRILKVSQSGGSRDLDLKIAESSGLRLVFLSIQSSTPVLVDTAS